MQALQLRSSCGAGTSLPQAPARGPVRHRCSNLSVRSGKGFGTETDKKQPTGGEASSSAPDATPPAASVASREAEIEAIEERLKSRRARKKVEPKVKVESAVVKQVTGEAPATPQAQAESSYVAFMAAFFLLILLEGLALAGSGFLPTEADTFIQEVLYPSYSPQILLFLGFSSLYGLFKTGSLPGQKKV